MAEQRIVSFRSLLATDRAVKLRGAWVRVHLAGRRTAPYWIEFNRPADAKRAAGSLAAHLREKVARGEIWSDAQYNSTIGNWIDQLDGLGYIRKKEQRDDAPQEAKEQ